MMEKDFVVMDKAKDKYSKVFKEESLPSSNPSRFRNKK